jgi:hypothetical protein
MMSVQPDFGNGDWGTKEWRNRFAAACHEIHRGIKIDERGQMTIPFKVFVKLSKDDQLAVCAAVIKFHRLNNISCSYT